MPLGLEWIKLRLDAPGRSILDRALADLNRKLGEKFRLIRLPSGKLRVCRVADLWFCLVGDEGQPPRIWTLAVDTRPEQRTLFPGQDAADFAECCDLLGFRSEEEQGQFREFLRPDADRAAPSPVPGEP